MSDFFKKSFRNIKNVKYEDEEVRVRKATSNTKWGASSTEMARIADDTFSTTPGVYERTFSMLMKRLDDHEQITHVSKALLLTNYLLRNGNCRFVQDLRNRRRMISRLKSYKFIKKDNSIIGEEVSNKAKAVYRLLEDNDYLTEERKKAQHLRGKILAQSNTSTGTVRSNENSRRVREGTKSNGLFPIVLKDEVSKNSSSKKSPSGLPAYFDGTDKSTKHSEPSSSGYESQEFITESESEHSLEDSARIKSDAYELSKSEKSFSKSKDSPKWRSDRSKRKSKRHRRSNSSQKSSKERNGRDKSVAHVVETRIASQKAVAKFREVRFKIDDSNHFQNKKAEKRQIGVQVMPMSLANVVNQSVHKIVISSAAKSRSPIKQREVDAFPDESPEFENPVINASGTQTGVAGLSVRSTTALPETITSTELTRRTDKHPKDTGRAGMPILRARSPRSKVKKRSQNSGTGSKFDPVKQEKSLAVMMKGPGIRDRDLLTGEEEDIDDWTQKFTNKREETLRFQAMHPGFDPTQPLESIDDTDDEYETEESEDDNTTKIAEVDSPKKNQVDQIFDQSFLNIDDITKTSIDHSEVQTKYRSHMQGMESQRKKTLTELARENEQKSANSDSAPSDSYGCVPLSDLTLEAKVKHKKAKVKYDSYGFEIVADKNSPNENARFAFTWDPSTPQPKPNSSYPTPVSLGTAGATDDFWNS